LRFGYTLCDLPDEIVLLIAAVEEGSCKGVTPILFRNARGLGKPEMIAVPATCFLPEDNLSQERFEGITLLPDSCKPLLTSVGDQRIKTFSILQIGMDVGVEEETADLVSFPTEDPQRVDGARSATDMQ